MLANLVINLRPPNFRDAPYSSAGALGLDTGDAGCDLADDGGGPGLGAGAFLERPPLRSWGGGVWLDNRDSARKFFFIYLRVCKPTPLCMSDSGASRGGYRLSALFAPPPVRRRVDDRAGFLQRGPGRGSCGPSGSATAPSTTSWSSWPTAPFGTGAHHSLGSWGVLKGDRTSLSLYGGGSGDSAAPALVSIQSCFKNRVKVTSRFPPSSLQHRSVDPTRFHFPACFPHRFPLRASTASSPGAAGREPGRAAPAPGPDGPPGLLPQGGHRAAASCAVAILLLLF